ncbi:MAG: metallophosphoesterase [Candidatus Diapherotrites archaeon]|nr:metallophosphoesterase [Candidatus Diapherotrites archaeon]
MAEEINNKIDEIIDFARHKKVFLSKDALEVLLVRVDWKDIVEELASEGCFIVAKKDIEKKVTKTKIFLAEELGGAEVPSQKHIVEQSPKNFKIINAKNNLNKGQGNGGTNDFLELFRFKFNSLKSILEQRNSIRAKPIKNIGYVKEKEELEIIGMVYRKWETKTGNTAIELEDLESRCIVVLSKNEHGVELERHRIMLDDVICVRGIKIAKDMILAKEVIWPDIPQREIKLTKKDVCVASISDLHVGSKLFLEGAFQKFISWINGDAGSDEEKKFVKKIKYLFVTGDNIDGIGVYPKQHSELNIKSIKEQYNLFSDYMLQIPDNIEIFIIPGQHDAVRWADPQQPIPEKFVPKLYAAENIHLLGSPSWVEIEDLKVFLYHGSCLHDLIASISGLSYEHPQQGVVELLKRRCVMLTYGLSHPYAPEINENVFMKESPDLVFMGDLHHTGYLTYRGTTIVNNSTWQDRTEYQIKLGHMPTPGVAIAMNLKDRKIYARMMVS